MKKLKWTRGNTYNTYPQLRLCTESHATRDGAQASLSAKLGHGRLYTAAGKIHASKKGAVAKSREGLARQGSPSSEGKRRAMLRKTAGDGPSSHPTGPLHVTYKTRHHLRERALVTRLLTAGTPGPRRACPPSLQGTRDRESHGVTKCKNGVPPLPKALRLQAQSPRVPEGSVRAPRWVAGRFLRP